MKNKKGYYAIALILGLYTIILFIIFGNPTTPEDPSYLILNSKTIWKYHEKKWSNIDSSSSKEYDWKEFNIYENQQNIGIYKIHFYNDKLYIYDDQKKSIKTEGDVLAIRGNHLIDVIQYESQKLDKEDILELQERLPELRNLDFHELSTNQKIELDIDDDQQLETIYTISNTFIENEETTSDKKFSIVMIKKKNKINYIIKDIYDKEEFMNHYQPSIFSILDVNQDGKLEPIIQYIYADQIGTYYSMYQKSKNKYQLTVTSNPYIKQS